MSNGGLIQIHHHTNLELLEKFTFKDGELYFDGVIVSREYTSEQIQTMIKELWIDIENFLNPPPPEDNTPEGNPDDDTIVDPPETPGGDNQNPEEKVPEVGGESGDTEESEGSNVPEQPQVT